MTTEYLIFNIVIFLGPIIVYFFGKRFSRPNIYSLIISIATAFIFFVVWDELVIDYFWFFNKKYITGFLIGKIPIEEMLFFISVPFACLLLWVNYKRRYFGVNIKLFSLVLTITSFVSSVLSFSYGKIYTGLVLLVFLLVIALDKLIKTNLFNKKHFLVFIFGVTNLLTFVFNLYLTSRPVVIYNELIKTNINIITIPLEDFIYGMALISLVVIIYEKISQLFSVDFKSSMH